MTADPIATFSDVDLARMRDTAWREAARCWAEWREADGRREDSDDARWLAQTLHDAAWSAEHHWRHIHDVYMARRYGS